ncbi:hypothetical protein BJX62DRAFT_207002 [Aspergillus germanicus]
MSGQGTGHQVPFKPCPTRRCFIHSLRCSTCSTLGSIIHPCVWPPPSMLVCLSGFIFHVLWACHNRSMDPHLCWVIPLGPCFCPLGFSSLESGSCLTVGFLFQVSLSSLGRHEPIIAGIPP